MATKHYLTHHDVVEIDNVVFDINKNGTEIEYREITDASVMKYFNRDTEEFEIVQWDFSVKPPRLYVER